MDLDSYKIVYEKYFKLACKVAFDIVHDYHLAGDVAQEVFEELFSKRSKLNEEQIKFWIVLNTNRRAIDYKRKAYLQHEMMTENAMQELEHTNRQEAGPEEVVLQREKMKYRLSALEELKSYNQDWYDILMRYHIGQENYQSLASDYGVSVENLRVQAWRARKWLDKRVYELYGDC